MSIPITLQFKHNADYVILSRPAVTEIKGLRPSTADQLLAPLVPRMRAPSTAAAQDNFEGVAAGGKGPLLSSGHASTL